MGVTVAVLPLVALGEGVGRVVPAAMLGRAIGREPGPYIDTYEDRRVFFASAFPPLVSGLLVALFYAFERRLGADRRSALWAAALLGACTYVATQSVFLLAHTCEALAILGSLYALHVWRERGRLAWLALGSALASGIVLIRVPAAVALPSLAGYLLFTLVQHARREGRAAALRALAVAAAPALAIAAVHVLHNHARWGTWIASPMLAQAPMLSVSLATGLHGLLFSPGTSLFVYSPLLLLLPFTLPGFWRAERALCLTVLALCASFLWLCGRFAFWHGLWSAPGARMLFALVPLLMLPLGPWLAGAHSRASRTAVAGLALAGLAIQLVLVCVNWRAAILRAGYDAETSHWAFLFDWARAPIVGCAQALLAGDVDVYLWQLAAGVPGRAPAPGLALALFVCWAALFAFALRRFRAALAAAAPPGDACA